jgi:hypothetical protein
LRKGVSTITDQIKGEPYFKQVSKDELDRLNRMLQLAPLIKLLTAAGVTSAAVEDPINTAHDLQYFVEGMLKIDPAITNLMKDDIRNFRYDHMSDEALTSEENNYWENLYNALNNPNEWLKNKLHGEHLKWVQDCDKAAVCWCGKKHCGIGQTR